MGINCSTPLYHDGMIFSTSAHDSEGGLVKLSRNGDGGVKAASCGYRGLRKTTAAAWFVSRVDSTGTTGATAEVT
ncbi:MAG: hypothetical protein FJ387_20435 [Verrucomicrobia bacterium]|nr:hypothetical protein [Verrucomicrobiota bacterium]